MTRRVLAITGGHRFDENAFAAMLDAVCLEQDWEWEHAEQPTAQRWLRPEHADTWDALVLYDLPGLSLARGEEPEPHEPSSDVRNSVLALLDAGQGIVALHHALAGWPSWDDWAEMLGGRFLYAPGTFRGIETPASGYRMGTYRVDIAAPDHPVCAGVEPFEVSDELYLCPVADDVTPLLLTDADTAPTSMIDTYHEVRHGEQRPVPNQPGSPLVGWARQAGPSRIVYLLPGHGPSTMGHPMYRRLLGNAIDFVSNTER